MSSSPIMMLTRPSSLSSEQSEGGDGVDRPSSAGGADVSQSPSPLDPSSDSPWAPLNVPMFRAFWIASLVSNFGTWVHEVGAGWLMTNLDASPEMVSAVRMALSAPTILLAIPAGVIADRLDRRRLLIVTQLLLLSTTATLASLTYTEVITAWGLLGLTFVIGLGTVMHVLTWQATVPGLVPQAQMSRAVALGSMSFNLARAIGPALGGLLIAMAGVWIAFAVNAMSFAGVLCVLLSWKREATHTHDGASYRDALRQGIGYVAQQAVMRNVLARLLLFLLPATALWALLPLIARQQLSWDASGFGLLVTMIGVGAVVAARFLHALHRWLGRGRCVTVAMLGYAAGLSLLAATGEAGVVPRGWSGAAGLIACSVMGAAWMITLTTLNATAQMTLPDKLRARGMGCYMTIMAIGMSSGAMLWGQIAGTIGLTGSERFAAAAMIATAAVTSRFRLGDVNRRPI